MAIKSLVKKVRAGFNYQPVVISRIDNFLRSGKTGSRALNFVFWAFFVTVRRIPHLHRRARHLLVASFSDAPATKRVKQSATGELPWRAPDLVPRFQRGQRVLIIAELTLGQCRKYRVEQKVGLLQRLGVSATVISWTDALACLDAIQTHHAVLFYRVPAFPSVKALVAECRRLGCTTFFDIDDLVFDVEEYARNKNVMSLPEDERALLLNGGKLYREMLQLVDHCVASTQTIAVYMRHLCSGSVFVLENCLDEQLLRLGDEAAPANGAMKPWVDIGYGSGTTTHDADFAVAAMALRRILEDCPNVRLFIYGPLNVGEVFSGLENRLIRVPFLKPDDYYRALARFDISIAPLEKSIFNDAKSNIKYLEASVFRVPSVCSPGAAFVEIVQNGENGFLACDEAEWYAALRKLVEQPELRKRLGVRAHDAVFGRYHPDVIANAQMAPMIQLANLAPKSSRCRILMVNLLFAPISFGGATIVAEQLAREVAKSPEHEVLVFSTNRASDLAPYALRAYAWNDVPVLSMRLPDSIDAVQEYWHEKVGAVFSDILAAFRPDVVHFHSIQGMGTAMLQACTQAKIPYVITLHDAWWICERQFMIKGDGHYCHQMPVDPAVCSNCVMDSAYTHQRYFHQGKMLRGAAKLLSPGIFHRNLHLASGVPASLLALNKNGIVPPKLRRQYDPSRPLTFAYLGGRATHKGYFWLKEIMASIRGDQYRLVVVDILSRFGDYSLRADHWTLGGQIEIADPFEPEEIDSFYSNVDVLLFPSQWKESFGLTVREALARNIWVISTDCGGPTEDIHPGENGDLVAMSDTEGFANAIQRIVDNPAILDGYINPHIEEIRTFPTQAQELLACYSEVSAEFPVQ